MFLNFMIIGMFIQDVWSESLIMHENWKKAVFAVCCFLLWIRVYYLMRVFQDTAHFITLISQIITDVKTFSIMLVIIGMAFANFYYVIDMGDKAQYVGAYTSNNVVNVLMEMYFISIGNSNTANYSQGENSGIIWTFFILASFIIVIVFMNLLISILSNTLDAVNDARE